MRQLVGWYGLGAFLLALGLGVTFCTGGKAVLALPAIATLGTSLLAREYARGDDLPAFQPVDLAFIGLFVYCFARATFSRWPELALNDAAWIVTFGLAYLVSAHGGKAYLRAAAVCLVVASLFHLAAASVQAFQDPSFFPLPGYERHGYDGRILLGLPNAWYLPKHRGSGGFNNPNHFGAFLCLMFLMLGAWVFQQGRRTLFKIMAALASLVILAGIILTGSRGALVSLVMATLIGILSWLALVARGRAKSVWRVSLGVALGVLVVGVLMTWGLKAVGALRFGKDTNSKIVMSGSSERELLRAVAWQQFTASPVLGTGAGTFPIYEQLLRKPRWVNTQPSKSPETAHCDILQFLSEYGAVGSILAALFVLTLFIQWFHTAQGGHKRRAGSQGPFLGIGALCVVVYAICHSFLDFAFRSVACMMPVAVILGFLRSDLNHSLPKEGSGVWRRAISVAISLGALAAIIWSVNLFRPHFLQEKALHIDKRSPLEAIDLLKRAWRFDPKNASIPRRIGVLYQTMVSKMDIRSVAGRSLALKSVEYFKKSHELFPESLATNRHLAVTLTLLDMPEESEAYFRRALDLAPNSALIRADYLLHRHDVAKRSDDPRVWKEVEDLYQRYQQDFYVWNYGAFENRVNAGLQELKQRERSP